MGEMLRTHTVQGSAMSLPALKVQNLLMRMMCEGQRDRRRPNRSWRGEGRGQAV